jgi:predicted ATPase/class 3 adenylate cyclase/DNA-binding XRE family transcriptional regulator
MGEIVSFGDWVRRRRRALDLTQDALAQQVGCALATIKKIEIDERRPSRAMAERLADCLRIPTDQRDSFLRAARQIDAVDDLADPAVPLSAPPRAPASAPASPPMAASGTLTFLFTDIAGSTRLWEQHPQAMPAALARHDAILHQAITAQGGHVFKTVGDAFCAAFADPQAGLLAALGAQQALAAEPWGTTGPLLVRMALHTGVAEARDNDYFGAPLNRVARLLSLGHGGQVLVSAATAELLADRLPHDAVLRDLGVQRLKDLARPERVFQLDAPSLLIAFPPLRSGVAIPHNLPTPPNPLIGREVELAAIGAQLRSGELRLLTLLGPGGTGKTRLALQAAREQLDQYPDGVWFVDLTPIRDPVLVLPTIARTLGLRESGSEPIADQLRSYMAERALLLLLDNLEQVIDSAPELATLLSAAPELRLLATSREALRLASEQIYAVPPLAAPEERASDPLSSPATQLFLARARAARADFTVDTAGAVAIAAICRRLEGLPLAIELAAARIRLLTPPAILERLSRPLDLLTAGSRDLPTRQQTLRTAIAWSYDLLTEAEQKLFRRLGVFVGGWTLEAAEAVAEEPQAFDLLAALSDKSLVRQADGPTGEARFTMLETIREYALERLMASGEDGETRERHANYCLAFAEATEPQLKGSGQIIAMERAAAEHDNLRAALAWSITTGAAERGLRFVGALIWFWELHDCLSEGRRWIEGALAQAKDVGRSAVRAKALYALSQTEADQVVACAGLEESVAIWREIGDRHGLVLSLSALGWAMLYEHRTAVARSCFEESVAIGRELHDKWGLSLALYGLGAVARRDDPTTARPLIEECVVLLRDVGNRVYEVGALDMLGAIARSDHDQARAGKLYAECLAVSRELNNKAKIGAALLGLGDVAQDQGKYEQAVAWYQESLALLLHVGVKERIAWCLMGLGGVTGALNKPERSARLLSAAETLLATRNLSVSVWPDVHADYDRHVAAVRAQLGEEAFTAAWTAGRALSLDAVVALALEE